MPNWESEEREGYTCKYCHKFHDVDEWHTCEEGAEHQRKLNEAFEKNYEGAGRIRGRLTIVFECNDSDMSIQDVISDAETEMFCRLDRVNSGADPILDYRWVGKLEKVKIK